MATKNIYPLKIQITTNIEKTPIELKYTTLYDPVPVPRHKKINISEYPYFTADVLYDEKLLEKKTYSEIVNIFFDKREFFSAFFKETKPADTLSQSEIANQNIMTMLKFIFPMSYPSKDNINTSYRKYLLKKGPKINISLDMNTLFPSKEISAEGKRNYSYIKTAKGICTVSEVIWLNDILNNKLYLELINQVIEYNGWHENEIISINKDIETTTNQLQNGLIPVSDGGTGTLVMGDSARAELESQKHSYNPDDIKEDMKTIIRKYLDVVSGKETRFNDELEKLLNDFIDNHITKPKTSMTQLVRFKDNFNFKYKTKRGETHLFSIHKNYNGENEKAKIDELKKQRTEKNEETDKLMNGYIDGDTFIFGIKTIQQYLKNLHVVQSSVSKYSHGMSNRLNDTEISDMQNLLKSNIPIDSSVKNIKILDNSINASTYGMLFKTTTWNSLSTNVNKALQDIPNQLGEMINKLNELNNTIMGIDTQIAKWNIPSEEIFSFKDEKDGSKMSIDDLLKTNKVAINAMQDELFKKVIVRYNRFKEIQKGPELMGQYVQIDNTLDTIITEIQKLEDLAKSKKATTDEILNITELIKKLFDQLIKSKYINISKNIGDKLGNIIKLSNQIKLLTQLKDLFFKEPVTGIFVDYAKTLDSNDSFIKLVIEELKQDKYANLKKIIDFIDKNFIKTNVGSLNSNLDKLVKKYFANESNEFYTKVVDPVNKLLNGGITPDFADLEEVWDVSVISANSTSGAPECSVSLFMDVIEGELNDKNKNEIICQYKDEALVNRWEELTDDRADYGPPTNATVFSLKKAKKEVESSKSNKDDQAKQVAGNIHTETKTRKKSLRKKGDKRTKTKKHSKYM